MKILNGSLIEVIILHLFLYDNITEQLTAWTSSGCDTRTVAQILYGFASDL